MSAMRIRWGAYVVVAGGLVLLSLRSGQGIVESVGLSVILAIACLPALVTARPSSGGVHVDALVIAALAAAFASRYAAGPLEELTYGTAWCLMLVVVSIQWAAKKDARTNDAIDPAE